MDKIIKKNTLLNESILASLNDKLLVSGQIYQPLRPVPPLILTDDLKFETIYVHDAEEKVPEERLFLIIRMALSQLQQHDFSLASFPIKIQILGKTVHFNMIIIQKQYFITALVQRHTPTPQEEAQDPNLLPDEEMDAFTT